MTATAVGPATARRATDGRWDLYKGWFLGFLVVFIVLAVGAGFWFHFHP
jgi:hypothetical protein